MTTEKQTPEALKNFPNRRAVEREIESLKNPVGMHTAQDLAEEIKRLADALTVHSSSQDWFTKTPRIELHTAIDKLVSLAAPQPAERVMWPATEMFALKPIGFASVTDIVTYAETLTVSTHLPGVRDVAVYTKDQLKAAVAHERNTAQQPAERKPLTLDQIIAATDEISLSGGGVFVNVARAIEKAHGIGIPPTDAKEDG